MALRQLEEAIRGLQRRVGEILQSMAPVGTIQSYAGPIAPPGYVLCDGAALSRAEYPALFDLVGTLYGAGDGKTTFNVPDARGRVLVGRSVDHTEFNVIGKTGGTRAVALTAAQLPPHDHKLSPGGHAHSFSWGGSGGTNVHVQNAIAAVGAPPSNNLTTYQGEWSKTATTGAGETHTNLQPYITVQHIIKAR